MKQNIFITIAQKDNHFILAKELNLKDAHKILTKLMEENPDEVPNFHIFEDDSLSGISVLRVAKEYLLSDIALCEALNN